MNKQLRPAIAGALGMMLLILDGRTALAGMGDGIELCMRVLIPSLFPYFVLSGLLTASLSGTSLPLLRPLCQAIGIPAGCEHLLAVGVLGGYPVGARNLAQAWEQGQLTREDAARILPLCNNAGPAFIFGMLSPLFSDPRAPWLLWLVHLGSMLLVGYSFPGNSAPCAHRPVRKTITFSQVLEKSLSAMGLVCGWVVLFRLALAFLDRWFLWLCPPSLRVFSAGLLELANGCLRLETIASEGFRFLLAGILLAFGGVCVGLQTASVSGRILTRHYFLGKLLQAGYAGLLSLGLVFHWIFLVPGLVLPLLLRRMTKNRSSISLPVGV